VDTATVYGLGKFVVLDPPEGINALYLPAGVNVLVIVQKW
jgi:hypothetical protein